MGKDKQYLKKIMPKGASKKQVAQKTAAKVKKPVKKTAHKVYHKPRFFRPSTKTQMRKPKLLRDITKYCPRPHADDPHRILIHPVTSDKNVQKMENENTLTFVVAPQANKRTIALAFTKLHQAKDRRKHILDSLQDPIH